MRRLDLAARGLRLDFACERSGVGVVPQSTPPRLSFPDRLASDLRLLTALILEESLDRAQSTANLYAVETFAKGAAEVAILAAAIGVVDRWKDRLLETEEPLD